jgi:hypothetical protein
MGKTIMYNTRTYKLQSYRIQDGVVTIVTDSIWLEFSEASMPKKVKEFLLVEDEKQIALQTIPKNKEMIDLKTTLMNNIKNAEKSKDYIPQALAINKSVNTIISLARLELSYLKLKNKE